MKKKLSKYNLIGISGYKGSGKDTVGSIIQYLLFSKENPEVKKSYKEWIDHPSDLSETSPYAIKKFAEPLKEMVCILLGCSMEDLEDHDFKEKELGEEWWIYKTRDYGDYTIRSYKNNSLEDLHRDWKEVHLIKLTPRKLLQLLGTECGRDIIHPNVWVNALFSQYKPALKQGWFPAEPMDGYLGKCEICDNWVDSKNKHNRFCKEHNESQPDVYPNWIITDVRFPNETQAIKDRGGVIIRVNRKENLGKKDCGCGEGLCDKVGTPLECSFKERIKPEKHSSETALDNWEFDHVIQNDSNIESLIEKVKELNLWK